MIFEKAFGNNNNTLSPLDACCNCAGSTETGAQLDLDLGEVETPSAC